MQNYELVVIIHPDLDEEAITQALDKVKDWVTKAGGSLVEVENWGKKHLAYEIQKQNEGVYYLLKLAMPTAAVADLERNLTILEPVMRHLIVAK
jgi:small subunit ribosomal protein S6